MQGLTLRKVSTADIVSTQASCMDNSWFGSADSGGNLQKIYVPRGLAADRAGNLYTATYFFSSAAGTIIRTTPAGTDSVMADVHTLPGVVSNMTGLRPYSLCAPARHLRADRQQRLHLI